jgi:Zn-dependent peptidase ImmA (M78 family)
MSEEEIYFAFDGKLIGSEKMKHSVCEALSKMPKKVITKITKTCWFMSSMDDAYAYTFIGNDLKDQYLIFLGDDLLNESPGQIRYSIAHEIGHVVLGHQNSVARRQTQGEIAIQEKEADEFAQKYA